MLSGIPSAADIINFLQGYYADWGYWLVFLGSFFENTIIVGLFAPGGTILLLAGFYAKQGALNLSSVMLLGWAGMFLGDNFDYWLGRTGRKLLRRRVLAGYLGAAARNHLERHPRLANLAIRLLADLLGVKDLDFENYLGEGRRYLLKHGGKAVFVSHFAGHIRSVVAVSAGAAHLPYRSFVTYDVAATLVWSAAFSVLGYFLGQHRVLLEYVFNRFGLVVFGLIFAYLAFRLIRAYLRRRKQAKQVETGLDTRL